jgi:carboxypeptidase Taq
MNMIQDEFEKFRKMLVEMELLNAALALLDWDSQVYMPKKGAKYRGMSSAALTGLLHDKALNPHYVELLLKLHKHLEDGQLDADQSVIVREAYRVHSKEKLLPAEFVRELAELTSQAHHVWDEAKKTNDFAKFAPILSKIVALKRQQAKYYGFEKNPYDGLLDDFEPGLTSEEVSRVFGRLKDFLVPFIGRIRESKVRINPAKLSGTFDLEKQKKFNKTVAEKIGYDFDAGRLDETSHPFMTTIHSGDHRITTRYDEKDFYYSLGSTVHEVGHALYEQGMKEEHFGTPLAHAVSLSIHESQSRTWENLVGKSLPFWKYFYPSLREAFPEPFAEMPLNEFYRLLNRIEPSLIRTESDEVTYNLHIIIRFEIEKDLIEGTIEVSDLPKIWNAKYKEYLGIDVPDDARGVLQDVHWSMGGFGYFPTYALGNLYSAQFFAKAESEIMNLGELFEKGHFQPFLEWLRRNIHEHGQRYSADALVRKVTGDGLNPQFFIDYVKRKFSDVYKLGPNG